MASLEHWRRRPRETSGPLDSSPIEGKPTLKTLEAEIRRQVVDCYQHLQKDLDHLHEQVHQEVYTALSQELVSVAQNLTAIRCEAHERLEELRSAGGEIEHSVGALNAAVCAIRSDLKSGQEVRAEVTREVQDDIQHLHETLRDSLTRAEAVLQQEVAALRTDAAALEERLSGAGAQELAARVAEVESKLPELASGEALAAEAAERATRAGELAMAVEVSRAEARQAAGQLEASIRAVAAEASARERDAAESHQELAASIAGLERRLDERAESASAEALAEQSRASTVAEAVAAQCTDLESRLGTLAREVEQQVDDARRDIRQLGSECREGLGFAHTCWTRAVDWTATVDLVELDRAGRFDLESPRFAAAGLRDLQLCLRLAAVEKGGGSRQWACGVFLRAAEGQVAFRLHVAGKAHSFAGDFANAPEWGSQRMVTLESVGESVPVRLEILDVTAPLPSPVGAPDELVATIQMTDAARVAAREGDRVRSSMVRRIEWRVARVSERVAAARAATSTGDKASQALEPLLSPPFSAGGLEGLQLQLFPLGYLRRDDVMPSSNFEEKCGFFLVCPKGVYMKCRAFVGDQVKIFEHQYAEREPFGRGNFCRLNDKGGADDCIVCGIEILDVRQELTTQVKGGPFGSVVDQMKVTLAANLGSMEVMRELRDAGERGARAGRHRPPREPANAAHGGAAYAAAALTPLGPSILMSNSHSLPALLPEGGGSKAVGAGRGHGGGSWPPSPGPHGRQKMTLPKI